HRPGERGVERHARALGGQDRGVDHHDVGHREEGRDAGRDFDGGTARRRRDLGRLPESGGGQHAPDSTACAVRQAGADAGRGGSGMLPDTPPHATRSDRRGPRATPRRGNVWRRPRRPASGGSIWTQRAAVNPSNPSDLAQLVRRWNGGDPTALDELASVLYDELRVIAHSHLARERDSHTLSTTALVHEAYLQLAERT